MERARLVPARRRLRTENLARHQAAVVFDLGPGHRVEVGDDLRPGTGASERRDAVFQRLLQHQREEAAEHVAADGLVELVEDRPGRRYSRRGNEAVKCA
jgi:hypothetical protein